MTWDRGARLAILRERAPAYLAVALEGIAREYPHLPQFVAAGPGSYQTHRELHPAFFGCFDWHSCVEMHWAVIRILRRCPECVSDVAARFLLGGRLRPENIAAEVKFFSNPDHGSIERPYGWGWLLTLQHELATWDDPDAQAWSRALEPLSRLLAENLTNWLARMTYPQRTGVHPNTAFGLSRSLDLAQLCAASGDYRLLKAIHGAARRWFQEDVDYPARYEPSGADFLSAALCEAELMSRILEGAEFSGWLGRFLPGIHEQQPGSLFCPPTISDSSDSQIGHLHGLNLSRAWACIQIAGRLAPGDPRIHVLDEAAALHAQASLPQVPGSNYMLEHWLAAYATLLLS